MIVTAHQMVLVVLKICQKKVLSMALENMKDEQNLVVQSLVVHMNLLAATSISVNLKKTEKDLENNWILRGLLTPL